MQFVLLAVLASMDRTTRSRNATLAERATTDPMMTSQVLRALEDKSLVERHAHPTDGRARILMITPAGILLVNRTITAVEEADRTYFSTLGNRTQDFTACLATLSAAAGTSGKSASHGS